MREMDHTDLYPLTLPQQTFYYDYLLHQNDSKYNMGGSLMLKGDLDVELFEKACNFVVQKFDSLRIRFVTKDGQLFQQFLPEYRCHVDYLDFRNKENPLDEAIQFLILENARPFPFEEVTLFMEMVLQIADKQYILFPRFHHFANDGYGKSVVNQALSTAYNILLADGTYPEMKSYSYLDFLEDDRDYRISESFKNSSEFWRKKLMPLPEPLDFTTKKYSLKDFSLHNERITLNLHRICYASLLKIADETGITTFQALLGILYTTLHKLYGRNDIVVGMPVLNRSNHKFRNTPGLFMNMIPLRLKLDSQWTFTDILNAIKAEVKECYRHQRLPLSETFRYFRDQPEFKNELFDVTMVYRKMDFSQQFGEAKLSSVTLDTQLRNESLSLEIDEYDENENVNLFFNYNPLVLSETEAIQFARCFEAVLFELIYFPDKRIADVKFISAFEQDKILKVSNANGEIKRTGKTVVAQFEDCVHDDPHRISVVSGDESFSYLELNTRANQIANLLVEKHHLSKGDIVCLAVERTKEAIAAMVGIMKAGAVCLPVDSHIPLSRLKFILGDSGAKVLVTDQEAHKELNKCFIWLNDVNHPNEGDPSVVILPEDLAYVIYTSGSTGAPKGVMIEHGSFMHMFVNMIGVFGVSKADRVLQFASLGFDAAVFEIFQALLTGAALVIVDKEVIQDPTSFIGQMNEQKITIATIPPAYLSALDKADFPNLLTLVTAGEPAILGDANHYKKSVKFINGYGPTETSVCASYFIAEREREYKDFLPVGKSFPGSSLYILNQNLELLPIGFAGELCVSGPSLARGYLNNKELTDQRFVPNPFEKGKRMYRTGDKARLLPDGNIEFIGRIDHQVKINGNRIELGEIEHRLQEYALVKEAVVLDVEVNCCKNLAAYIVGSEPIDLNDLRRFLREYLPEYMVPQYFHFIGKIPLTQNLKIDRKELRNLAISRPHDQATLSHEPTVLEQKLIPIFEKVLGCRAIGVDDNFFELGGESLKIARLITFIRKELQLEINFKTIFDKPTVRGVAAALANLNLTEYHELEVSSGQAYYPLSHAQQRLWILSQDKENASVYNMPVSLLLEGAVHTENLKASVQSIVDRHEVLRTIYTEVDGTPFQSVLATCECRMNDLDFSSEVDPEGKAMKFVNKEVMAPFDLACEIPVRASIVKMREEQYVFLLVIHHIAGDGISVGIVMNELSLLYNSFSTGALNFRLKPLRNQYKDYCLHEKRVLASDKYLKEKAYWLQNLGGPIPVLQLPTDRPRPPMKSYRGNFIFGQIDPSLAGRIFAFGKENGVSSFMVMLAAVNILLHKYTSEEDIIVGSPVAGRNHENLEDQVGVYINTVALRNSIEGETSFWKFLQHVKEVSSLAFSNSNYPFDSLLQNLNLERDTSRSPIFDVLVQYQNVDVTAIRLNEVKSSFYRMDFTSSKFDLVFTFTEKEAHIEFSIGYNSQLFDSPRIERAAGHLVNILASVMYHPEVCIDAISILGAQESERLLRMSEGPVTTVEERTVNELFGAQVEKTPDQMALVFSDTGLTYRQLDARANVVANRILEHRCVAPDDIVAIMAPRSELMVIGLLGILKAGAAYLPIDPELPPERIKFMLSDSRAKMLLTETSLVSQAEEMLKSAIQISENEIIVLDISHIESYCQKNTSSDISPSNLAYVIYTSGSTGTPKGVMVEHGSLCNLVKGLSEAVYHDTTVAMNIALISPFFFDASVKQIFYALLKGHCLYIVPDEVKSSGRKLLNYYKVHSIHVSDGTPVHLEIVVDELEPGTTHYLPEIFVIGGQQLMPQTVQQLFDSAGEHPPVVTNVYGPTECCDVSTSYTIGPEFFGNGTKSLPAVPIGKPLTNIQVYILDANLAQLPVGVEGELFIAGEGLARGYIHRADLTEERFFKADFLHGKRLYKTGDKGHFLDNGDIVLSGRSDDQIKLRGYRIELTEIENCLRNYPGVNLATVIPVGAGNETEIAAYYTTSLGFDGAGLRQFVAQFLPGYMVPSHFIALETMPVTPNGKVNKKALPAPVKETNTGDHTAFVGDLLEEKLASIWKELLHLDRIGLTDNFFSLGGHSLIAIRLVSQIHKKFNIEISIWEVFQHATISALAMLLRSKKPTLFDPIKKIEELTCYPLSHAQRRLWFLSKLEGQNSLYNLPAALHLIGDVDVSALGKVFDAIVQRHESFRTYFVEIEGEPFQKIVPEVEIRIEISEYQGNTWDKDDLREMALAYFQHEFDLSKVPLLQIKLILLSDKHSLLLFNMHHIISDGWSIEIMLREFETYYNVFLHHLDDPLPPLRIQYKDYAAWQNSILGEASLGDVKDYWQQKLAKPRPLLNLPADFTRPEAYGMEGDMQQYTLKEHLTKELMGVGSKQNATLFMTLLSSVYILLYKYTGEEDLIVGSPVAGRQHYDIENQVGFFINTIALRTAVNPEFSFQELLCAVKETMTGAFANQVYPFDRLVDELEVERIQNRNPLFDVMVAWMVQNGMGMKLKFNELEIEGLDFRITKSMFDLTFLFDERDGKVAFAIEYNTALFRKDRIDRMADHFVQLLENIVSKPKEKIKFLDLVPACEKEKILHEFNHRNARVTLEQNVIGLFDERANISKKKIALVYEAKCLTYEALDLLSNRIANFLKERVAPAKDEIIAVVADDPLLSVAAILGVMKTGAAYLPVAPDTPAERLSYILKDSRSKAVLVDNPLLCVEIESWEGTSCGRMVFDLSGDIGENASPPEVKIEPNSLAYLIYTSGSTGLPKGVLVEHESLASLISSLDPLIYTDPLRSGNELMLNSFAFDVSLKQVFACLCHGNTLHLMGKERRLDAREIIRYLQDYKINVTDLTPSLFSVMLEEGFGEAAKPDLKELFLGSEALPLKSVKKFYSFGHNAKINITNFYGPTECCVESSSFRLRPDCLDENYTIVPIGKPVLNEQIYVLDKELQMCPVGIPGEICIAGKGLAREYLNDPGKTNEKFVFPPWLPGTRIYKTGDIGRTRSDGNIEFLGRVDEQVKIRGYRIELQEIEKQLREMDGINDCAVVLFDRNGSGELVAYFTANELLDGTEVKRHLERFLPRYMVPAFFVRLEKIPLSANGKANKKLLPDPSSLQEKASYRGPQDEVEKIILSICSAILKKEGVTLGDNFFEIGGHSLNAVRVISQIQRELNINLPLKEIFYTPVLLDIANKIKELIKGNAFGAEVFEEETSIVPLSDEELELLSNIEFDSDEE